LVHGDPDLGVGLDDLGGLLGGVAGRQLEMQRDLVALELGPEDRGRVVPAATTRSHEGEHRRADQPTPSHTSTVGATIPA